MSNPSLVIVLVEDAHHKMLIWRYLRHCGLNSHEISVSPSPAGRGSAESWVRKKFVKEIGEYRARQARAGTALIVMIDADALTVQERLRQLDQALRDEGKQAVGDAEQIARLVPKRNVETWILCLNQDTVDEDSDYSEATRNWNNLIRPAAETLRRWTQSATEPPGHCVSSLRIGVRELKRLNF